jgi:hypothetical protein
LGGDIWRNGKTIISVFNQPKANQFTYFFSRIGQEGPDDVTHGGVFGHVEQIRVTRTERSGNEKKRNRRGQIK